MNFTFNTKWVAEAFPVPGPLTLSNTSVDISDGIMRFFECTRKRGVVYPKDFGTLPFPRLYNDKADEAVKKEAILVLKKWAVPRNIKIVNAIIHEDEAYVFKVTVPTNNPKEIRPALEALLEENVPIPPSDALFEYSILASDQNLSETTVAVSVISKTSALKYLDVFAQGDISVVSLETESRAIAKTIFPKNDTGVHAVLSIAKRHSVVCIIEKGAVVFSSSIEVGDTDLTRAVAMTLNIKEDAAETMRKRDGRTDNETDIQLFEAMMPVFGTIRDELGKMLVYWKTQGKKERQFVDISDIILLGSGSVAPGFAEYITAASKIPAKIGSVWTNTLSPESCLPRLHKNDSLDYGSLIGTLV